MNKESTMNCDCVRQNPVLIGKWRKIEFSCMYLSIDTNLPPFPLKKILQGQLTSSPFSSMCFLSSVVQYCGVSSVETAYCGL